MERYLIATILGVAFGTAARSLMLRSDYRQFPAFPHGYITHLSLGLIAAVLGSLAIPALWEKEFTAVTFLSLAATQFRDIREVERKTLTSLDLSNLVPRGPDYIEGIARVFEARNYLVMVLALLVSGVTFLTGAGWGVPVGVGALVLSIRLMRGKVIEDVATVRPAAISFKGPNVFVENIHFMNLAREEVRRTIMERGLGVIIEPYNDDARAILANNGQRMAIAHDAVTQLGIYKDVDTAEFTPILRRDLDTGRIGMLIAPLEPDMESLLTAVRRVPVLESAGARPLQSRAGRKAAD
ncbi:MAG: YIEGIA family protein [Bacillota bacterium]